MYVTRNVLGRPAGGLSFNQGKIIHVGICLDNESDNLNVFDGSGHRTCSSTSNITMLPKCYSCVVLLALLILPCPFISVPLDLRQLLELPGDRCSLTSPCETVAYWNNCSRTFSLSDNFFSGKLVVRGFSCVATVGR